ncbi:hypothetical protein [Flavobacterium tiangeerense]|uniref:hypothetical protein n=1 Tax=Flavobacterium tiangeerense TaxID=459471 RepID=UPI0011A05F08|nr:hypothetical protein [Flavobacterium tiangeerense]
MSKNVIHNFNLSIQNSADIKSAEHLTNVFIKELAKVSKGMSQQKDIVQIWQELQLHNTITNDLNSPTEGGAIDNTAATIEKTALSTGTTPSANGDSIKNNTTSSTVAVGQVKNATSSLPDGGGVTDTTDKTAMRSLTSDNTTPPISEVENDTTNKGITSIAPQPYANVGTQESVRLPQHLKENNLGPTIDEVKKGVQTQLNNAIKNNDTEAIKYWSDVLDKLEKGASIADYKNDPRFNLMYNELKPLGGEIATFYWDNIRLKMIAAIESKILNDQISIGSKNYWNTILKELKNEQVNIANLFEQYDELFLLLREVEGLTQLPNSITFFTKTKVYPNLSPDKMYANLGAQNVYAFLKELSAKDNIGAGVNKDAVFIKNTSAKTFILGESLEFGLNEMLVNQKKFAKENINWVVYLNNKKEKTFVNEGPNFSYNFEKLGNYIIEAYGEKADAIKDKKHSAYVDINIIKPEIEIIAPTNFSAGYARPFTEAKQFAVKLKANKAAKPKNPLQLFYQIEYKAKDEFVSISEVKPLSENGLFNISLPKLGNYTVIVTSNGQYPINGKVDFKVKENYVKKISITKNFRKDNIYLKLEKLQQVECKATEFLFNPATTEEMNNVKWVLYNEKELQAFNKENPMPKQPFAKGTKATFNLPLTEGKYWVEAYSNTREGKKSTSSQEIQVVHPTVTEANWTDASGTPKTTSGFIGEINYVKATVPNFCNEEVRIYFHVKAHKDSTYCKNRYFITTKTDSEGKINTAVSFSKEMKAKLGISNWNVNLKFALVGIVDNQLYAFKGISYPVSNAELKVTTKKEILDLYFEYEGKRLVPTDRVPYNSKTPTKIKMVAHTRNMIGEKIKFTVHALKDDSILENLSESAIKANGIAELSFQKKAPAHLKKDDTETYYAGVEGFSTKHFKDKTLVFQVGAKFELIDKEIDLIKFLMDNDKTLSNTFKKSYTPKDAEDALFLLYKHFGVEISKAVEMIFRSETGHFTSDQYILSGTGGMESFGRPPYYGWYETFFTKYPKFKPLGITSLYEGEGISKKGGNAQIKNRPKEFVVMPSVLAAMLFLVDFIIRHDGNWARWHSIKKEKQEAYRKSMIGVIPRFVRSFDKKEVSKNRINNDKGKVKLHFEGTTAIESSLSEKTKKIIVEVGKASKNYNIYITSTARSTYDQARIMYENCSKNNGVNTQKNIYKDPGDKVIDVYANGIKNKLSKSEIIKLMENKIKELGPSTVSKHIADYNFINTFDISYSKLSNKESFYSEILKRKELEKIMIENNCYHLQIIQ